MISSRLLSVVDLIFVFNLSNAEKLRSEIALEGKLNCNEYIHFLIIQIEEILVCKNGVTSHFAITVTL